MPHDGLQVYHHALKWRQDGTTHNGFDQEGCAQAGIVRIYIVESQAVNGWKHERHKRADAYQAIETGHADYAYGAKRAHSCPYGKGGKQHAGSGIAHEERGNKPSGQEKAHGQDVICLCRGLVDAQIIGILDDERPHHDLCCHVEHLRQHALTIYGVVPKVLERHADAVALVGLNARLGYLDQGYHDEHEQHHAAYCLPHPAGRKAVVEG